MNCDRSKALVSVYVDGELSEELAGPLRRHLMECAPCRASVSEAKALASWFVPTAALEVPEGFAARVARLAASGAGTLATSAMAEGGAGGHDWLLPARAIHDPRLGARSDSSRLDRTARFAMSLAAVAAALLIGLTLLLSVGDGQGFDGAIQAQPSVENALDMLEELNRLEREATSGVAAPAVTPETPGAAAPAVTTEQQRSQR